MITAENIEYSIDGTRILNGISLDASKGLFTGVIGPNGSGKSTLLKCLYRVLKPTCGAIFIDGKRIDGMSVKDSARKLAVVAQHNYCSFDFTVEEVVMMGRSPYKGAFDRDNAEDYRIVRESLEQVGLAGFAQRSFFTLSGGEQQRVILARALTQQTPCLILDEPTNHLDIKYQLQLMDIVKGLNRTVISAIHDLNIAAMYCDRLYVMKDGHVAAEGTPEEVLTSKMIKDVYEVDADVFTDRDGNIRILYNPACVKAEEVSE